MVLWVGSTFGVSGNGDSESLEVSVVRGQLLTVASASHNRVCDDSLSKL